MLNPSPCSPSGAPPRAASIEHDATRATAFEFRPQHGDRDAWVARRRRRRDAVTRGRARSPASRPMTSRTLTSSAARRRRPPQPAQLGDGHRGGGDRRADRPSRVASAPPASRWQPGASSSSCHRRARNGSDAEVRRSSPRGDGSDGDRQVVPADEGSVGDGSSGTEVGDEARSPACGITVDHQQASPHPRLRRSHAGDRRHRDSGRAVRRSGPLPAGCGRGRGRTAARIAVRQTAATTAGRAHVDGSWRIGAMGPVDVTWAG